MNEKPTIIVTIHRSSGEVEAKVLNVQGPKCTEMTAPIRRLGNVLTDEHTPDFYQAVSEDVSQNIGQ
jgi:hypothetical protein